MDGPVLPYADAVTGHSSGWSGSDTSEARAHKADLGGATQTRQERVLMALGLQGHFGATCNELLRTAFADEDAALLVRPLSGVLTTLHKGERIARLTGERSGEKVYVLPEFVGDRAVEPPKKNLNAQKIAALRNLIGRAEREGRDRIPVSALLTVLDATKFREKE